MKFKFILLLTIAGYFSNAQSNALRIHSQIRLPQDSVESQKLITALNEFLDAASEPNEENSWILETQKIETYILLDEFKDIKKSREFSDDTFYKPYLNNVIELKNNQYLIQLSYIGVDNSESHLRASFELIAHQVNDSFRFSSPLLRNTEHWQKAQIGNNIFRYEKSINMDNVETFSALADTFDKKLKVDNQISEFYCTENLPALLNLIGVQYRSDYNGRTQANFSTTYEGKKLIVLGNDNAAFDNLDPHDLWHDRLSLVISRRKVNKPVDEACAYLYGGSWGLSWHEIFNIFLEKVASNKKTDWTEIKENPLNFGENRATHLMADYVVNALIVQKIEKEKGFDGVWEFLNCGPYQKGNDNYHQSLERLTGITKKKYNKAVWELIEKEKASTKKS
ncbi:hypothetical protein [Reichenbachiella sp.]|uniref:hypothetical protein n=1 Tax=Reichenbachiella sp. TaxID=2184521 RepID=UPI003299BBD8